MAKNSISLVYNGPQRYTTTPQSLQGSLQVADGAFAILFSLGEGLDLLVFGSGVALGVDTPMRTDRELETVAFELTTVRDRLYRSGVLVQHVDLFEGQALGLKQDINFLVITGEGKKKDRPRRCRSR